MKIVFFQLIVPIICYFIGIGIGIMIGLRIAKRHCEECKEVFIDVSPEEIEIQHVGYTPEQCGYDK